MIPYLLGMLSVHFTPLNALTYTTSRTILAMLTGFACSVLLFPKFITWLRTRHIKQPIRSDGPNTHLAKAGTPAMGGVVLVSVAIGSTLLWAAWATPHLWVVILTTLAFGLMGLADDIIKGKRGNSHGLSGSAKLILGSVVIAADIMVLNALGTSFYIALPFLKHMALTSSFVVFPFIFVVILGTANAANLTDGLDGLLVGILVMALITFGVLSYLAGHKVIADYLFIPYVAGAGELAVLCAALVGAALGFLWYNCHPASIFMGDSGALAIGAALGLMSVIIHHEFLLLLCCGVMVAEAISVMLQVSSYKLRKHRIFLMAPLHHHFELKGWKEPQVIVRFWVISFLLAILTLITLKLR